ncbi:C-methyltransferase CouO [Planctomycetes bacterium MalM25]|nr:C-methyltransferase CouO [Planctomycetes bacterium MalM25]
MSTATYRWNADQAAADYDAAGPVIHPLYDEVQERVVDALAEVVESPSHVIDLGGGSGRLAERVLERFPQATVTVVDPSEPFLRLARRRLARFGKRARYLASRAQEPWNEAVGPADAIVSTSALHHLDSVEKNRVFTACHAALKPDGAFINGDEYRPPSDRTYRELLEEWGEHMRGSLAAGLIPDTFGPLLDRWEASNLHDFGGPRESGDDCHETVEEQSARLYGAGFREVRTTFRERLWGVVVASG